MSQNNLGTSTLSKLQEYIQNKKLTTGDKLPSETELTNLLKVGHSTIREAIRVLAYSGLLEVRQGSGTYIKSDLNSIKNDNKLRSAQKTLEYQAVRELVETDQNDADWLLLKTRLERRNQLIKEGQIEQYIEADIAFHNQILQMSQNPYLIALYQQLSIAWKLFLHRQMVKTKTYQANSDLHNQLFDSLVQREAQTAIDILSLLGKQKGCF